jgi:hypothetical protein
LPVHFHYVSGHHLVANPGAFAVDKDVALFDVTVSLAA